MARKTEKYTKEQVYERTVAVICDWCECSIPLTPNEYGPGDTREFQLVFTTGTSFPEGGSKEGWEVQDLCDACVIRLRTLLEDQGVRISEVEGDW